MADLTPEKRAELRRLAEECESKRVSSAHLAHWGKSLANLSRAMTPLTVLSLLDALDEKERELALGCTPEEAADMGEFIESQAVDEWGLPSARKRTK